LIAVKVSFPEVIHFDPFSAFCYILKRRRMSKAEEDRTICRLEALREPSSIAMNRITFSDEGINSKFTFQILSTDD